MFETESSMVQCVVDTIGTSTENYFARLLKETPQILREVGLGYGVADLVFASATNCTRVARPALSSEQIQLMQVFQRYKELSIDKLETTTGASRSWIVRNTRYLEDLGYLRIDSGTVFRMAKPVAPSLKSIAVEAKLKNWRRALDQAYRYKWFANISYVCLPENSVGPALTHLELFRSRKVGLFTITPTSKLKFYYKPRSEQPKSNTMQWLLAERVLTSECFV